MQRSTLVVEESACTFHSESWLVSKAHGIVKKVNVLVYCFSMKRNEREEKEKN